MREQAAEVQWTVDEALKYAEDPQCVTRKSERVLALEVRRLRMEAIDQANKCWDWQRRALEAEEKLVGRERPESQGAA